MSEEEVVESTEEVVEEVAEETPVEESSTSFVDNMLSQIDNEDVKSAGFWKNLEGKDANEVGQYIKELQSFAGKKGDIPKSDASQEEWDAFYQKLGRPENVEGYDFEVGDNFKEIAGEETPFFENAVEGFKQKAFELGASSEQAEGLVDWYLEMVANNIQENNTSFDDFNKEQDQELRREWGEEYDGMWRGIESMLVTNGMPQENYDMLKEAGIFNDPNIAVALGNIASKFADDPEIGHHQTKTLAGINDQLFDVEQEVKEYLKTGTPIPTHIREKMDYLYKEKFKREEK
tara:strand:- start:1002 stop:1871 length:870 start_codon:yes stop_codon:yes gene_type:complete